MRYETYFGDITDARSNYVQSPGIHPPHPERGIIVTTRERIRAWLARRLIWLAAAAVSILFLLAVSSERQWHVRAAALERENLTLQLKQLAQELTAESEQLASRASELAQSQAVAELLQDAPGSTPADRSALINLAGTSLDSLLVVSAAQAVRFSAKFTGARIIEGSSDPGVIRFLNAAALRPADAPAPIKIGRAHV